MHYQANKHDFKDILRYSHEIWTLLHAYYGKLKTTVSYADKGYSVSWKSLKIVQSWYEGYTKS